MKSITYGIYPVKEIWDEMYLWKEISTHMYITIRRLIDNYWLNRHFVETKRCRKRKKKKNTSFENISFAR